tara:strand:+ start:20935 stop:22425 length:1491 start_codon:yes stop_codon:yes gene_type:complete
MQYIHARLVRYLSIIEKIGNRLPHPTAIFIFLAAIMVPLSELINQFGIEAQHPVSGELLRPRSLASAEGLSFILTQTIANFTHFAPLGSVLIAMLGLGIAEKSGLLSALLSRLVKATPARLLAFVVIFAGILSNLAVDAGYVVLIPLAGSLYLAAGRNPLAGIGLAFAGVSAGFSANLIAGPFDAIMAGLSQTAAQIIDNQYTINLTFNYYFMAASTLLIAFTGSLVNAKWVEPYLGEHQSKEHKQSQDTLDNHPGLIYAAIAFVAAVLLLACGLIPEEGFLREPQTNGILSADVIRGSVVVISLIAALCGLAYGWGARTITTSHQLVEAMEDAMKSMSGYIVLMFFAAQFVAYFNWTQLGPIFAISGADSLRETGLSPLLLLLLFMAFSALLNLFIGSASAKWAILAPVFIPLFMLLGMPPEATTAAYRVADSVTNIITPLMPYFGVVLIFVRQYQPNAGLGTLAAMMFPYAVALGLVWALFFSLWFLLSLPFGF